jgi:hypothetical protein
MHNVNGDLIIVNRSSYLAAVRVMICVIHSGVRKEQFLLYTFPNVLKRLESNSMCVRCTYTLYTTRQRWKNSVALVRHSSSFSSAYCVVLFYCTWHTLSWCIGYIDCLFLVVALPTVRLYAHAHEWKMGGKMVLKMIWNENRNEKQRQSSLIISWKETMQKFVNS